MFSGCVKVLAFKHEVGKSTAQFQFRLCAEIISSINGCNANVSASQLFIVICGRVVVKVIH